MSVASMPAAPAATSRSVHAWITRLRAAGRANTHRPARTASLVARRAMRADPHRCAHGACGSMRSRIRVRRAAGSWSLELAESRAPSASRRCAGRNRPAEVVQIDQIPDGRRRDVGKRRRQGVRIAAPSAAATRMELQNRMRGLRCLARSVSQDLHYPAKARASVAMAQSRSTCSAATPCLRAAASAERLHTRSKHRSQICEYEPMCFLFTAMVNVV